LPTPASEPDGRALALYVHWPFCMSKCPYCDFNSHVRPGWDEAEWRAALLADLAHEAAPTPGRRLTSIFFGGGTPSLMHPATAGAVIEAATRHWHADPDLEITLEANPSSVEAARFAGFRAAGVNRVSLGIQSLDDAALRFLGRAHGVDEALSALDLAQRAFPRVSFDLICAIPGQTEDAWVRELTRALGFGTEHLSIYQLTIEPGTRFQTLHAKGELRLPDEDRSLAIFDATEHLVSAAGLHSYEVSNHARPGAESRHNLTYWTYGEYVGVGPGAHGRRGGQATVRAKKPENWLRSVAERGHGIAEQTAVPPREAAMEALLMGLRLARGIDTVRFEQRTSVKLADAVRADAVSGLAAEGLLVMDTSGLRVTSAGRLVLNSIIVAIAA